MKALFTLFAISLITFCGLNAQNNILIKGKVIDQKTNEPIGYAHVGIPEKGIGTTTAFDGTFYFKVPKYYDKSTMIVSFIGYKTFRFPINQIKDFITIELQVSDNELVEVVVMEPSQVEDIIRKAVRNIPKNYPTYPTKSLGFYRESRTNDSLVHTYMAEGVLNIYKKSYKKRKKTEGQVSLVQGRRINLKNPLDTVVGGGFTSGHMAAHRFDFVQNREDFLKEKYFPLYKYWVESITTYNDRPVYIIAFDKDEEFVQNAKKSGSFFYEDADYENGVRVLSFGFGNRKKRIAKARMKGRIFIDKESYAFIKAEFEILPEALSKINDYPLYAGRWKSNSYIVNYRQVGDKWYFSDATREGMYYDGGMYSNEIKLTEINLDKAEQLPYLERISRGDAFTRMTGTYDPDFWKNYNTTPLSYNLAESVQAMENAQKAAVAFDPEYLAALEERRDSIAKVEYLKRLENSKVVSENGDTQLVDVSQIDISEFKPKARKKINRVRVKSMFGVGTHFVNTQLDNTAITYFSDSESPETILDLSGDINSRDFEIVAHWDWDIEFHKNFFTRFGIDFDFANSIYKHRSIGLGTQFNLSRQRPFFIKAIAQYSHMKYARKLGAADNNFGKFNVSGKKFKGDSVNLYYGTNTHNLKLSSEISVELHPGRELYVRGTYLMPFANKNKVWFKERKQFSRKRRSLNVENNQVTVTQNGLPLNNSILPDPTFSISIGILFK